MFKIGDIMNSNFWIAGSVHTWQEEHIQLLDMHSFEFALPLSHPSIKKKHQDRV